MNPHPYNIVDLGGIDLATLNGEPVDGIYDKILDAMIPCKIVIFSNWYFASILIAPSYVVIDDSTENQLVINDLILVTSDDKVSIPSMAGDPTIEAITFTQNGIYTAPVGVDGYSPVTVDVPSILPVLESLSVTENGQYLPPQGADGFSDVTVNVPHAPSVLEELTATSNGQYLPSQGVDGFSKVNVNVPIPVPVYPYITPDYMGLSYGYISTNGKYFSNPDNTAAIGYFPVTAGKYVAFVGQSVSNRFRIHFYAGKSFADFEQYALNPEPNAQVYECTQNITGSTDLTGEGLIKRIFFTVSSAGEVIITTSNLSVLNPAFLFKIS